MERNYRKGGRRNWRIRFIDETEYWDQELVLDKLPEGCKIISAYIFDPGEVTHLCSVQGSQWHVGICTFIVPPDSAAWSDWRENDPDGERERLCDEIECTGPPDDDYFGDLGEADSIDSGIRVRRFRTGDTWIDAIGAGEHAGTPGETNWEEAANHLIEGENTNTTVSSLYQPEKGAA